MMAALSLVSSDTDRNIFTWRAQLAREFESEQDRERTGQDRVDVGHFLSATRWNWDRLLASRGCGWWGRDSRGAPQYTGGAAGQGDRLLQSEVAD